MNTPTPTFAESFWDLYQRHCRPAIEAACIAHARRLHSRAVDLDDMVSWIDCRVWRMVRERPPELLDASLSPQEAALRITRAANMLARWAHLALVRAATNRSARERPVEDIELAIELGQARSTHSQLERSETTAAALNTLRAGLSADLRARLAASWKQPDERERIAAALGATRPEDEHLRQQIYAGAVRTNTVEQIRSRSLSRSRDTMKSIQRTILALMLTLSLALLTTAHAHASNTGGGGDNGGEQTGGR